MRNFRSNRVGGIGISVHAVNIGSDVDIDDVAICKTGGIRDAMTNHFIQ